VEEELNSLVFIVAISKIQLESATKLKLIIWGYPHIIENRSVGRICIA
jgi:hypothetical protein